MEGIIAEQSDYCKLILRVFIEIPSLPFWVPLFQCSL
jgi:hypothetical protein